MFHTTLRLSFVLQNRKNVIYLRMGLTVQGCCHNSRNRKVTKLDCNMVQNLNYLIIANESQ